MPHSGSREHLTRAAFHAERYLDSLPDRRVGTTSPGAALAALDHPLPDVSVCSWMTTAADVDRSADAIVAAARMPG